MKEGAKPKRFHVEQPASRRLMWSLGDALEVFRRLPVIRWTLFGAEPRNFSDEGQLLNVLFRLSRSWYRPGIPIDMNVLASRGPVHLTICAHEGLRRWIRRAQGSTQQEVRVPARRGAWFFRFRYTWRLTVAFGWALIAFEWCHTPNFERLEGPPNAFSE